MCYPLRTGFVVHVSHVFNVHRGRITFKDYLKAVHDTSQSSLWRPAVPVVNNVYDCVGCPIGVVQVAEEEEDGCVRSTSD